MKTQKEENVCQYHLADPQLRLFQEKVDSELAEQCRNGGCLHCKGKLHSAAYDRKPRGGPAHWDKRASLCCAREGCRKRHTPPSVRFLGRKVYVGTVVILLSAMRQGINAGASRILSEKLGVDKRTLERWKAWWSETFVQSSFWKTTRSRFMPLLCEKTVPHSLCLAFDIDRRDRLLDLLKFLGPITTTSVPLERLI